MKRRRIADLLIFSMLLSLTACSDSTGSINNTTETEEVSESEQEPEVQDTHSNDGRNVVGISMPSQKLERWNRDGSFLKQQFEQDGYEVLVSYGNDLIDDQINGIEDMIKEGADLLIITPIDATSLTGVLKDAADANIPVISYDRLILQSPYIDYYISFDNYKVGTLQGEFIRDALDLDHAGDQTYNIEFVGGDPADNNAQFFYGGAYDVLSPYIESGALTVLSGQTKFFEVATSSWSKDVAKERFEDIINSYYGSGNELAAVCCSNDATALGAQEALDLDYKGNNEIIITGQDADEPNMKNIVDGKQSMTVYKALSNESVVAVALGKAIINGEKPGEELIQNGGWDFSCNYDTSSYDTGEKVVASYLLDPIVITAGNMKAELVDKGYYTEDEQGYLHPVQ